MLVKANEMKQCNDAENRAQLQIYETKALDLLE
jgi:hypothetical protein